MDTLLQAIDELIRAKIAEAEQKQAQPPESKCGLVGIDGKLWNYLQSLPDPVPTAVGLGLLCGLKPAPSQQEGPKDYVDLPDGTRIHSSTPRAKP